MGKRNKNCMPNTPKIKQKCYYLSFVIPDSCTLKEKSRQLILKDILAKAASDNSKHKYVYTPGPKDSTLPKTLLITQSQQIPMKLMQLNYELRPPYHGIVAIAVDPDSPMTIAHKSKNCHKTALDTEALRLKNLQSIYLPVTAEILPEKFPTAVVYEYSGKRFLKIDVPKALRNTEIRSDLYAPSVKHDFHTMRFK